MLLFAPRWSRLRGSRRQLNHHRRLRIESLEARELLATFLVTNTLDAGPGSLRQALIEANVATEPARIVFNIPRSDPNFIDVDSSFAFGDPEPDAWRIDVQSELPELNNPIAGITVDGHSQREFTFNENPAGPEVILDGGGLFNRGFFITTGNHAILGFNIRNFGRSGINIVGGDNNVISGNFIGTDATGWLAAGNGRWGVLLEEGASRNRIGTDADDIEFGFELNVISGNTLGGVGISDEGSDHNVLWGNYIGTNVGGTEAIGNLVRGVEILPGAKHNFIGTNGDGIHDELEWNVISGNVAEGVGISGAGTSHNTVAGNLIGTDWMGRQDLGNGSRGVAIFNEASRNTIGGGGPARRNVISGNDNGGINITSRAFENHVAGNFIGTNITGKASLANTGSGVRVALGARHNTIGTNSDGVRDELEGNVISGNTLYGVRLADAGTNDNLIAGNFIGTDLTGVLDVGNEFRGIAVEEGAGATTIGGATAVARNVIGGNNTGGIRITPPDGGATTAVVIIGNIIGADISGSFAVPNSGFGILIEPGAAGNRIGTNGDGAGDAAEGNLISGNENSGVRIFGVGTANNVVAGNRIGTDAAGLTALPNLGHGVSIGQGATAIRVGTNGDGVSDDLERNIISGNTHSGVSIADVGTDHNVVAGNYIGTDLTATAKIPNTSDGVIIFSGAQFNRIGADGDGQGDAAERNIIAGNGGAGVTLSGVGTATQNNIVVGNSIGTNLSGTLDLGNTAQGVRLQSRAVNNRIGGSAAQGNVIAFNKSRGVGISSGNSIGNAVQGNSIYANVGLGIDLGIDGLDTNDATDRDSGPNRAQNSPVIKAVLVARALTVDYVIDSFPSNATYPLTIDFYLADSDGQEGQTFVHSVIYDEAAATFSRRLSFVAPGAVSGDRKLVATATDAAGNTSEFSVAVQIEARPNPSHNFDVPLDVTGEGAVLASDALALINYLNAFRSGFVPVDRQPGPFFYDTTNDGQITPLDALAIINWINGSLNEDEEPADAAEGEPAAASDLLMALWPEMDGQAVRGRRAR